MEIFTLDNTAPSKEFKLNSADSYLHILKIELIQDEQSKLSWQQIISNIVVFEERKYIFDKEIYGREISPLLHEKPIHIDFDLFQVQPIFHIDKVIKNDEFKIYDGFDSIHYSSLKIELFEKSKINEKYALNFFVEKFEMD